MTKEHEEQIENLKKQYAERCAFLGDALIKKSLLEKDLEKITDEALAINNEAQKLFAESQAAKEEVKGA